MNNCFTLDIDFIQRCSKKPLLSDYLIEELEENGFELRCGEETEKFIKERCEIIQKKI